MAHQSSEKYNLFRNYMTNELGITRADIEAWTKESVAVEVNKKLGQINVDAIVRNTVDETARRAMGMNGYSAGAELRAEVARALAAKLDLTITATPKA